ncbi:hypothetical protein TVAG_177310 [Trichomonas vaginalis G3]|uniref:Uncharacterized protein n=1 Tax=Trichomonas vaginalis (strain ATCC PRA-98 / G3) TaxID=412133 RepID=A2FMM3_TRIV3|nr:hypothetical protein TVAGG3_1003180 [Trichomonas vaginalis G3]EAX93823.1 hypothetical protein TVAG_177310 [Trichomonas vaginalis G3]KAI5490943.1 hypothetical protein TVAGG3_1003180 [Trichomonas vaginalis G3]|eukprot:XP_001306753.1 hypothetical protein [Trichomonas vaginalis G3]
MNFQEICNVLKEAGYTFELHPLGNYLKIIKDKHEANLSEDAALTYSLYTYKMGDQFLIQDVSKIFNALNYKGTSESQDNADQVFHPQGKKVSLKEVGEKLKEDSYEVINVDIEGGYYMSLTHKNNQPILNGKTNIDLNKDGVISLFSEDKQMEIVNDIAAIFKRYNYSDHGPHFDGATHSFFKDN